MSCRAGLLALLALAGCANTPPVSPAPEPAPSSVGRMAPAPSSQEQARSVALGLPLLKAARALTPARFTVIIGPRAILLDGVEVAPLPEDMLGVAGAYKRSGPNDLYIVPLAEAIAAKRGDAGPPGASSVRLEVAPNVTYRLFTEVAFTLGQAEVGAFHLVAPSAGGEVERGSLAEIVTHPPRARTSNADSLNLAIVIVGDGISIKGLGGNVAPGCKDIGPGLSLTKGNTGYPFGELTACMTRLKASSPELARDSGVVVLANPRVPFSDVMSVMDAVRGEQSELFPDVTFGIAR